MTKTKQIILQIAMCTMCTPLSMLEATAQETKRTSVGKTLMNEPRPRVNTNQNESLSSRHSAYRTYNGWNNNLSNGKSAWGAAEIPLYREMPAAYGFTDTRNAMAGTNRPSARKISNVLIDEPVTMFDKRGLSTLMYQWGQFLDHEITLTPTDTTEYVPILLPPDEKIFTEEIPFYRSEVQKGSGIKNTVRQQLNLNTSWIDGSVVYGSDVERAQWLRTFRNGKLKTSAGNLLPYNTIDGEQSGEIDSHAPSMKNDMAGTVKTFVAGDARAAENPVLTSIQTLFVREHNRICDRLKSEGLRSDEQIYQMARKEIGALIEAITYQEFLPALGVTLRPYAGYNADTRPDITNTFATAAYRLGHTMVSDDVLLLDNNCNEAGPGEFDLVEVFWNPGLVSDYGIDNFIKGSASHDQYETDTKINSVLRNFLFGNPNDPVRFGIDLGSLNIQRGRDHGMPDYNAARRFYTGSAARKFSEITSNDTVATALKSLYGDINNIDLWIGILAEDHLPGKSVGKTLHEMLRVQFEKLRNGDFYFYLNDPALPGSVKNRVKMTTFGDVIKRNTTLTSLQRKVFFTHECPEDAVAMARPETEISGKTNQFRIYPNPVSSVLHVDLGNINQLCRITLSAANGKLIKRINASSGQNNIPVNINNLANGMYIINVSAGKNSKTFKFLKMAK